MNGVFKAIAFVSLTCLMPLSAKAEQLLASYVADLGPEDHYNSSGQRLTSFAALLAQDRANYHRFGIRHASDGNDPIFANRAMRAQIGPGVLRIESYYNQYVQNILNTQSPIGTYMVVEVYGSGNTITRISIVVPG